MSEPLEWYNFKSGQTVYMCDPTDDLEARELIPQAYVPQTLYRLKRANGASIIESLQYVLEKCVK